ncbi:hypothetical protein RHGRI_015500 [Rhododendron griersonianum]|uniref:Symplekin n=1 Tax=Rhododendron griersonianum TaxID=479676 RepID=A0AAV6KDI8_9ERIC|nr:hypothetical protein RHGRI_015500 [Rhododendron griersonianum]
MVGIMAARSREKLAGLIDSAKLAPDITSKLEQLRRAKDELSQSDPAFLSEFLPPLLDLHTDRFGPVRKFVIEMVGDIGLKHIEFIPEIVPVLITLLKDGTPAVARQAIACGVELFRSTLLKVAIQGLYSSELDGSLESSWAWVLRFRDQIYSIAFQPGSDGIRLPAVKFVEVVILLYTPDPEEPPLHPASEEKLVEFNISWIRGGHPMLNVGDLSIEASQSLGLLLDELRLPMVNSLSNSMIIVLINGLSAIAKKRPAFYGRILPVLLGLDPSSFVNKGFRVSGAHHALKNAFICCLNCTHPGAAPWRDRLVGALSELEVEKTPRKVGQINGSVERKDDSPSAQEEKSSIRGCEAVNSYTGRKRSGVEGVSDVDDDMSGKRIRSTPIVSEGSEQDSEQDLDGDQVYIPPTGHTKSRDVDNGPVHQLVAMFGALVAQGEKAIESLEILISSISADLLAEVVMANMRHLPPHLPKSEGHEEPLVNMSSRPNRISCDTEFKNLSSILTELLSSSAAPMQMDSLLDGKHSSWIDMESSRGDKDPPLVAAADNDLLCAGVNYENEEAPVPLPVSSSAEIPSVIQPVVAVANKSFMPSEVLDYGNLEGEIPGLDSASHSDGLAETPTVSSLAPTDLEDASREQVSSVGRLSLELMPSISTDRSEELSPKAVVTDASSINFSTATSLGLSTQLVLPKMSAPVLDLSEEEKDQLQKLAFTRIVEAYKQIATAGGSCVRFALLGCLGIEFPIEVDPWKILQKHIFLDYMNHEGHELTLRVLYRLFGEAEEDRDLFSSTTATSAYEMFLLTVAETLRDSFPASDKSLSRLLGEAPYLPKSIFKLLECLCCPGSSNKDGESLTGDRVTQGLSAIWSLILLRPPIRDVCLKVALQSAVHQLEEVRMKAIRLVANKLYPLSSIAQQIEDFGKEMLYAISHGDHTIDRVDGNGSELQKDSNLEKPSAEQLSLESVTKNISSDTSESCISQKMSSSSLTDAQRCMSLYFALCTKKHSLFREIFCVYKSTSDTVKQAIHGQIPILVRTIGSSSELLETISDPPTGSEHLLMQVLNTLTDGTVPSSELILTIRKLYDTKVKDVEILVPVLSYLPKDEVLRIFPHLVNLPLDKFQAALGRILQVTDACNACFEQRQIFTQQVLAKVLNQLVEQIPLPLLFMRTVLQAIGAFPALVEFIMEILSRLVSKQIWKYPKLWVGFLKCAHLTKPQSFSVLLQVWHIRSDGEERFRMDGRGKLPPTQLENALNKMAALRAPLIAYASQPNIRSPLPRSVLAVLGIVSEPQNSSQAQTTPAHNGDVGDSDMEAVTEKSKESSSGN